MKPQGLKKLIALMLTLAMALCAFACAAPAAEQPAAAPAQEAEAATPTIDKIKEAGKLVMLTNATFPPFEYVADDGSVVGVDADIAKLIADAIGVELEIVDMDFDLLIDALATGKGDLVAAGMTVTEERQQAINFSTPYIAMGLQVVVPADSDIASFDDLAGKKIAVQLGTTGDIYAAEQIEGAEVLSFKGMVEAGQAVLSGNAEAAIIDVLPAEYIVAQSADALKLLGVIAEEETALGVAKGQDDLLTLVNDVLAKAEADGYLQAQFDTHMASFDPTAY